MSMIDTGTTGAKVTSWARDNPRNLLLKLRQQFPAADEQELARHLRDCVLGDDSDCLLPILRYYVRNNLRSLENMPSTVQRMERTKEHVEQAKGRIIKQVERKLLDLIMPSGKLLAQSTGAECLRAGGWFAAIGKRIKANEIVGNVLDEQTLQRMFKRTR